MYEVNKIGGREMNIYLFAVVCILIGGIIVYVVQNQVMEDKIGKLNERLDWFRTNFLIEQGFTQFNNVGNYRVISVDGGQHWIAMSPDNNSVLGDVEKVYPGLMEHIRGLSQLMEYVNKNGPINLSDPRGVEALTNAGFKIEKAT